MSATYALVADGEPQDMETGQLMHSRSHSRSRSRSRHSSERQPWLTVLAVVIALAVGAAWGRMTRQVPSGVDGPVTAAPVDPYASRDAQSSAVSALHLLQQEEPVGCAFGRSLSVVDCRHSPAERVGGFDWRSGRVHSDGASCVAEASEACEGRRACTLSLAHAWLTYRCMDPAAPPLPPLPPLHSLDQVQNSNSAPPLFNSLSTPLSAPSPWHRALVVYVFVHVEQNPMNRENLRYFVSHAMRAEQSVDYVVVVNLIEGQTIENLQLPALPPNARYVTHKNECYDWGTLGWLARLQWELDGDDPRRVDLSRYSWFVLANPSVRGPMLHPWQDQSSSDPRLWWLYPFQHLLLRSDAVRAAGCTASFQIGAHIQSYIWVTDRVGWELLMAERSVTACHQKLWDTVRLSEVGSSQLMIRHGYNLAVLARVYDDGDFRRQQDFHKDMRVTGTPVVHGHWDFNFRMPRPDGAQQLPLNPLEIMFVKLKASRPATGHLLALLRYEQRPNQTASAAFHLV